MRTKQTIDLGMMMRGDEAYHFSTAADVISAAMDMLQQQCHAASYNRGWWHDPITGLSLIPEGETNAAFDMTEVEPMRSAWFPYVVGTKIALIHSEVSEMLEAHRTGAMDDKIKDMPGVTMEGADVIIRVMDLLGMMEQHSKHAGYEQASHYFQHVAGKLLSFNVGEAIMHKLPFNAARADHDLTRRLEPGGKKY